MLPAYRVVIDRIKATKQIQVRFHSASSVEVKKRPSTWAKLDSHPHSSAVETGLNSQSCEHLCFMRSFI